MGRVPEDLRDASRGAVASRDASLSSPTSCGTDGAGAPARVPRVAEISPGRLCTWCAGPIAATSRRDAIYCGVVCRKRAWRFGQAVPRRSRQPSRSPAVGPRARFAYADPPYPGKAGYYVERQEVDHASLLEQLVRGWPDGWALSTSAAALPTVLPMCPVGIRVCAWRRQVRPTRSRRPLSAWEPLLVYGGRELATDEPQEVIDHLDYRGRYDSFPGALVGMKPPEFAVWLFALLGAGADDELDDLFPGSGAIGRAWALYTSRVDVDAGRVPEASATRGTRPSGPLEQPGTLRAVG